MPRIARKRSYTNVYHIILRGINKQDIFYEDLDRKKFIKELINVKENCKFDLYAYCLMDNHVHLLIRDYDSNINKIMQSLTIRYAIYFNKKYERVGHLFSNRYNSKPVETDSYFIRLQRYIHQNPEKAFIEKTERYKWSSYNAYIKGSSFVDIEFFLEMLSQNKETARYEFKRINRRLINLDTVEDIMEYEIVKNISDTELRKIIESKIGKENLQKLNIYNSKMRNEILRQIREITGVSNIQLSRVLGVNRKMIDRLKK